MAKAVNTNPGIVIPEGTPMIYPLIGEAMRRLTAVGKDSVNKSQGFKYRGIDAIMNALYPVMSELGLFVVPEVIEQAREERTTTKKVWDDDEKRKVDKTSTLLYSILKTKYTFYAPDGSNVSAVIVGEGMDSGDKASNKALAVALKYACFQVFMIPTEEMANDDPDRESHEVNPKPEPKKPEGAPPREQRESPPRMSRNPAATVEQAAKLPENLPGSDESLQVMTYLANECAELSRVRNLTKAENKVLWDKQVKVLKENGKVPNRALSTYTKSEAEDLVALMYSAFTETGTELKVDEK